MAKDTLNPTSLNECYDMLVELWSKFSADHQKTNSMAAQKRARVTLGQIKNLVTPYRKFSLEECGKED